MRKLLAWLVRAAGFFRKNERDIDFAAEVECHLQLHMDDNLRSGMSPEEARRAALLKLGGVESLKESHRDRRSLPTFEAVIQCLRFAVRSLLKTPGFTLLAIGIFALGIGASTALFSVIDALLLRSLPFPDPHRLAMLWETDLHHPEADEVAPTNFFDWQKNSHAFASMGAAHLLRMQFQTQPGSSPARSVEALLSPVTPSGTWPRNHRRTGPRPRATNIAPPRFDPAC